MANWTMTKRAWQVPVRRSLLLVLALALAMLRGRRGGASQPLAAASLAILAVEPQALFGASFQLSFAASAALAMAPRLERWRLSVVCADSVGVRWTADLEKRVLLPTGAGERPAPAP